MRNSNNVRPLLEKLSWEIRQINREKNTFNGIILGWNRHWFLTPNYYLPLNYSLYTVILFQLFHICAALHSRGDPHWPRRRAHSSRYQRPGPRHRGRALPYHQWRSKSAHFPQRKWVNIFQIKAIVFWQLQILLLFFFERDRLRKEWKVPPITVSLQFTSLPLASVSLQKLLDVCNRSTISLFA